MASQGNLNLTSNFVDEDNWYIYEPMESNSELVSEEVPACRPTIPSDLYHCYMAPISLVVLLILSLLVKRKKLYPNCCHGAPGLMSPVNFLEDDQSKGPVLAVFGILFSLLGVLILDNNPLPFISNSSAQNRRVLEDPGFILLPCLLLSLIGMCHSPAQDGVPPRLPVVLESFCSLHLAEGGMPSIPKIYKYYSLLSYLPIIFCLAELSLWYPVQLIQSFRDNAKTDAEKVPGSTYCQNYLRHVLSKKAPVKSTHGATPGMLSKFQSYLCSYVYTPQEGFQIPLTLTLSLAMAGLSVYQVALLLLTSFIPNMQIIRSGMSKEMTTLFVQFGIVPSEKPAGIPGEKEVATARHYIWSVEVCFIFSLVLACLLTFCMLLKSLGNHRTNLQHLYRGATLRLLHHPCKLHPSQQSLVCWMYFAAFQAASTCLALLIQHLLFFICTVNFTFLIIIPLQSGAKGPLFKIVENVWLFWLTVGFSGIAQNLLAHYCFLERDHLPRVLTNRRALHIATFVFSPINVVLGLLAGIWRILVSVFYNVTHLCRLDVSLLSRGVEGFDPGYQTYCQYLKMEASQSHPLMRAFCSLLVPRPCGPKETRHLQPRDAEEGIKLMKTTNLALKGSKGRRNCVRWGLAYTLLNNPSLLPYRKGALLDPKANGTFASPTKS